jgi:hypothetical protein
MVTVDRATCGQFGEPIVAIQRDGRAFVTGAVWNGRAAIRAAFDNWRTARADLEQVQSVVLDAAQRVRANA